MGGLPLLYSPMMITGNAKRQETGCWANNRAENSQLPFRRRERAMLKFSRGPALQKFSYVKALVQNHFNQERHFGTVRQNELEPCRVVS